MKKLFLLLFICVLATNVSIFGQVTLDGVVSSGTADGVSTINVSHTTGTSSNRLMLVGISSNSYNSARTINSVKFGTTDLTLVGSRENEAGRLIAIYGLIGPPSGVSGTVTVTFSGSVNYGIVVGVVNFAGVDQVDPLGDFVSAVGTETATISVDVPTNPNDWVFDTIFLGAATVPSVNEGTSQSSQWNLLSDRARGAGSTKQATTETTTMSWTTSGGSSSYYWVIGAVPINPAATGPTITVTGSLNPFSSDAGTPSDEQSYSVSGSNLTDDITITAPTDFEISTTSGSSFGSSVTLTRSGDAVASTPIYVRFNRATGGTSSGNITHTSSGATEQDIAVSGTAIAHGTISYVGTIGSASDNNTGASLQIVVCASGVSQGNTIIIGFASRGVSGYVDPTVSDSKGNSYSQAIGSTCYTHGRSYIFYAHVTTALVSGDVITINTPTTGPSRVAVATEFSGVATTSPLDLALGNPTLSNTSTPTADNHPTVGLSSETAQGDELIIGVIGTEDDADAGNWENYFTAGPQIKTSGADYEWRVSMGYLSVINIGTYTASKTLGADAYWASSIATFKSEAGLPVELNGFTASVIDNSVQLEWNTATEVNNYGFDVERKSEKSEWAKIGFVAGSGNSNSPKSYSYTDQPGGGISFSYRLKQIDNDGAYKYYDAITVKLVGSDKAELMQNNPNPFNPSTSIKYYIPQAMDVTIKIYDVLGREVTTLINKQATTGYHVVYWNGRDSYGRSVASGVYLYRLTAGTFSETKKMNLLK